MAVNFMSDEPEFTKAQKRVGDTYEKLAQWLLNLSCINLDDLSKGDRTNLEWEAEVFFDTLIEIREYETIHAVGDVFHFSNLGEAFPQEFGTEEITREKFLGKIHQLIFGWIDNLKKGNSVTLENTLTHSMNIKDGRLTINQEGTTGFFEYIIMCLIDTTLKQFRLCLVCNTPFIAVKRQEYCSTTCSQTMRTRKFRAKRKKNSP